MGRGRDADAVAVVHKVAAYNGTTSSLTLEDLTKCGASTNLDEKYTGMDTSAMGAAKRQLAKFDSSHIKALFQTRQLAWSTSLTISIWGAPI